MFEPKYHITLTEQERSYVIRCLNNLRTQRIREGHYTDAVDDLLVKIIHARKKAVKTS